MSDRFNVVDKVILLSIPGGVGPGLIKVREEGVVEAPNCHGLEDGLILVNFHGITICAAGSRLKKLIPDHITDWKERLSK